MTSLELVICAFLTFISGFLSASEVALFSLSRFQLRYLKEHFRPTYRKIKWLLGDPGGLLISILVINEVINISLSTMIAHATVKNWGLDGPWFIHFLPFYYLKHIPLWALQTFIGLLITAPIVLIFCEISPKVIAARTNQVVAPLVVEPLSWIYTALKPIQFILKFLISTISRSIGSGPHIFQTNKGEIPLREEEFLFMIEEGHKQGAIHESELELIRNVFELNDRTVREILTPISQVFALTMDTSLKSALLVTRGKKYSRIPVLGTNRKHVVGVLYSKDLLRAKLDPQLSHEPVTAIMRKPFVISPAMRLNALFRKLKDQKTHMAIIENAQGETLGIVTLDDVIDELFDELLPEEGP